MITRRSFLADAALAALAGGIGGPSMLASQSSEDPVSLDQLEFSRFEQSVNSYFVVRQAGVADLRIKLGAARRHPSGALPAHLGGARLEEFSLHFIGAQDGTLPQDTYTLEHARLGRFAMFIVPVGRKSGGHQHYEAVFNRIATT